jgi:P27 family predicted phage terminase small subunit
VGRRGPKPRRTYPRANERVGAPDKPDWLSEAAVEKWDELIKHLEERRVITRADGTALAILCETYSLWRGAVVELNQTSVAAETEAGMPKQSPEALAVNQLTGRLLSWLREFGLTPVSRDRVEPIAGTWKRDAEPLEWALESR